MSDKKKIHIRTFGCQMNVYDSDRMADAMAPGGWETTEDAAEADLVILNTCHIREKASEKVYSDIGRLKRLKDERATRGEAMMIGVAGCVAQAEGAEIMRRAPVVDLVFGPQSYHRLPELAAEAADRRRVVETEFPVEDKFAALPLPRKERIVARGPTAFLTVQEGCDKFCAFCVVPYTRGAETSRPVAQIVAEAERLASAGVVELTLLGQNVNAYHGEGPDGADWSLARLLYRLAEVPGIARLRYTTSHPNDMADDLIAAHRDLRPLMPYLHLPVQSGSDRILKAMNRRHDRAAYLRLVDRIRAANPDLALTSDFIVGFPGETDADFADTMSLVDEVGFAASFSFKYSQRPGTPAATEDDQVDEAAKSARLIALQERIDLHASRFLASRIGMTFDVLVEKPGRRPGQMVGRSPWLQPVHLDVPADLVGSLVSVRIDRAEAYSLFGTPVPPIDAFMAAPRPAAGGRKA